MDEQRFRQQLEARQKREGGKGKADKRSGERTYFEFPQKNGKSIS